jgi:NitT/TauT family transport system ATP-binding protein
MVRHKAYDRVLLESLQLQIRAGERVALIGPSGSGKTTLLNIIAGLDSAFDGHRRCAPSLRIAYMFQEPRLLPWRTVAQNLRLAGAAPNQIVQLLREVELEAVEDLYPRQLSLGMARRVALARALALQPDLLLLDEPLVSLDPATAERMRQLLCRLLARRPGLSLVLVSHDPRDADALATRTLALTPNAAPSDVRDNDRARQGITTK